MKLQLLSCCCIFTRSYNFACLIKRAFVFTLYTHFCWPFLYFWRIVRIVDKEGRISGFRESSETTLECTRQGYYRHPSDCSQFYRCVKFNQYEDDYTIFEYGCPNGLVFDDRWEVCVWPAQATPCDGSSEIRPVPKNPYVCTQEGYFVDPENCRWFFACLAHDTDGALTHYEFRCPFGLAFDEVNLMCNWPWLVPACGGSGAPAGAIRGGTSSFFENSLFCISNTFVICLFCTALP